MPNSKKSDKQQARQQTVPDGRAHAYHDPSLADSLVPRAGDKGYPVADVAIYQSIAIKGFGDGVVDGEGKELSEPLSLSQSQSVAQSAPAEGVLLTYAQGWYQRGMTLGPLIHSLSLAPGEVTQIAVVEREHTMRGVSQDSFSERESVSQKLDQRRAVSQITSSVAKEMMFGRTSSRSKSMQCEAGVGGLAGLFGGSASGGSNSAIATQVNVSSGSKQIAARAKSNIKQRTRQSVAQTSARQSVAIEEVSELSTESFRTRVVANYNHMHALNMQYYEVVQVYDLKTKAIGAERCIFVPMEVIEFDHNDHIILFQRELAQAAENIGLSNLKSLIDDFIEPEDYNHEIVENEINALNTKIAKIEKNLDKLKKDLEVQKDRKKMFNDNVEAWNKELTSLRREMALSSEGAEILSAKLSGMGSFGGPTKKEKKEKIEAIENKWSARRSRRDELKNYLKDDYSKPIQIIGERVAAENAELQTYSARRANIEVAFEAFRDAKSLDEKQKTVLDFARTPPASQLLSQLNERKLYFNQAIWVQMDAAEAASMVAGKSYRGEPIAPNFDPKPVAITGNYVAYRWRFPDTKEGRAASQQFDRDYGVADPSEAWDAEVAESGQVGGPDIDSTISIPTGALFAEAVLGESNAAEKLDLTRFWKWDENTIPIKPTKIDPLRSNPLDTQPPAAAEATAPTINIQNAAAMPDMPSFASLAEAMKAGTFRDMSGTQTTGEMLIKSMEVSGEGAKDAAMRAQENFGAYMDFAEEAIPVVAPLVLAAATGGTSAAATGGKMAASELSPTMIGALRNALGSEASDMDPAELMAAASKAGLLI